MTDIKEMTDAELLLLRYLIVSKEFIVSQANHDLMTACAWQCDYSEPMMSIDKEIAELMAERGKE